MSVIFVFFRKSRGKEEIVCLSVGRNLSRIDDFTDKNDLRISFYKKNPMSTPIN